MNLKRTRRGMWESLERGEERESNVVKNLKNKRNNKPKKTKFSR